MIEFRIGRGHDGPARMGEYIVESKVSKTPSLVGPSSYENLFLSYGTLGGTVSEGEEPQLVSLPFETEPNKLFTDVKQDSVSYLLPSLLSFSSLSDEASSLMLQYQLRVLNHLKPKIHSSQFILRIPESIRTSMLISKIKDFHSQGVRSAAFAFDGLLGDSDLNSIMLRTCLPVSWMTIALGKINPGTIPLLYYLGFDVIDVGYAYEAAALHQRLWHNGVETIHPDGLHRYCPCSSCMNLSNAKGSETIDILLQHNLKTYISTLSESVDAMTSGRLRWLVESTTHHSPAHASILRRIDRLAYSYIEEFTPTTGPSVVPLIGPESYNSPVALRFRETIVSRYRPPPGKKIVLLLPCSARKPYSDSKSHRRFQETIESALRGATSACAQVILTSPLGLVPRELERVFPAASYDIPVTGDWDAEEIGIASDALTTHLSKFGSEVVVIAHVSKGYMDIVRHAEDHISQSIIYTSSDSSPTARESREALQNTLEEMVDVLSIKESKPQELEEIVKATADFQFGSGAGDILVPSDSRLTGKPYRQILCRVGREQVCSLIASAGVLSLTLEGARRLAPLNRYWVRLDAPLVKGGSVFAVGIQEADFSIRPGDEVIVLNDNGDVTAVGRSEMSGREMCELDRGRAVSVRHKEEGK